MDRVGQSVNRMSDYSTAVYSPNLEAARQYQDFIASSLLPRGIIIQNIQSKNGQLFGENLLGLEIKFDREFERTRNLYIETAEKSHPDNPKFVPSGIYRNDNSWLYGIGNYQEFFIFTKKLFAHDSHVLVDGIEHWHADEQEASA